MRRVGWVLTGVVAGFLVLGGAAATSDAACAAPTVEVTPPAAEPGAAIAISGEHYGTECNDTAPIPPDPLGPPAQGVAFTLIDATGARFELATADAAADYTIAADATVPSEAAVGPGSVEALIGEGGFTVSAPFEVAGDVIPAAPAFTG